MLSSPVVCAHGQRRPLGWGTRGGGGARSPRLPAGGTSAPTGGPGLVWGDGPHSSFYSFVVEQAHTRRVERRLKVTNQGISQAGMRPSFCSPLNERAGPGHFVFLGDRPVSQPPSRAPGPGQGSECGLVRGDRVCRAASERLRDAVSPPCLCPGSHRFERRVHFATDCV